jgi:hypothetical protein
MNFEKLTEEEKQFVCEMCLYYDLLLPGDKK